MLLLCEIHSNLSALCELSLSKLTNFGQNLILKNFRDKLLSDLLLFFSKTMNIFRSLKIYVKPYNSLCSFCVLAFITRFRKISKNFLYLQLDMFSVKLNMIIPKTIYLLNVISLKTNRLFWAFFCVFEPLF